MNNMVPDSGFGRGNKPIINITIAEAKAFCNYLSMISELPPAYDARGRLLDDAGDLTDDPSKAKGYRLPTEAEWEYTARGGLKADETQYAGSNDLNTVGFFWNNAKFNGQWQSHAVGQKAPNELGIHDMSGNVAEFVSDTMYDYEDVEKSLVNPFFYGYGPVIFRGGSWYDPAKFCTVFKRRFTREENAFDHVRFRIARTIVE